MAVWTIDTDICDMLQLQEFINGLSLLQQCTECSLAPPLDPGSQAVATEQDGYIMVDLADIVSVCVCVCVCACLSVCLSVCLAI